MKRWLLFKKIKLNPKNWMQTETNKINYKDKRKILKWDIEAYKNVGKK